MVRAQHFRAALAAALLCCTTLLALPAHAAEPRKPVGVYLHLDIEYTLAQAGKSDAPQSAQDAYIVSRLTQLLNTSALGGVTIGLRWSTLEPSASGFDWSDLDDVFNAVSPTSGKAVQLIITPGFDAPQWLKDELKPCDVLFTGGTVDWDCGSAEFVDFPEQGRADKDAGSTKGDATFTLPLPWNTQYQNAWWSFLRALRQHLQGRTQVVAIQIAGPIGASDEMILPTTANGRNPQNGKTSITRVGRLPADKAWTALINNYDRDPGGRSHPNYVGTSDQIFIDQWKATIDKYEQMFSGLTLVLSPDSGDDFPEFGLTSVTPHSDNSLYGVDCQTQSEFIVSCEAKTEVISYFLETQPADQKGTEVGGMTASSVLATGDIGVPGTKLLTAPLAHHWTAPQAIGGAQFDHPASNLRDGEGCPSGKGKSGCPSDAEQATANVLKTFFYGTTAAGSFGNPQNGNETMNYVDVPVEDVEYMEARGCNAPSGEASVLEQIAEANRDLFAMAGQTPPSITTPCRPLIKSTLPSPRI